MTKDREDSELRLLLALNAVKLSARQVAQSFVPPTCFDLLIRSDNAILTGPRGSGKTTLLKMLTSEGLEHWDSSDAESFRQAARAVGVFIGTDRAWSEQLKRAGEGLTRARRELFTWSAVTTHVSRAMLGAMEYRVRGDVTGPGMAHLRVDASDFDERALSIDLSTILKLDFAATSLLSVRHALRSRAVELGGLRRKLQFGGPSAAPDWMYLDYLSVADALTDSFNEHSNQPDQKWALLFDELELAPKWVVEGILSGLRGDHPNLVFKLSMAPAHKDYAALSGSGAPVPGQDYEAITLTSARKADTHTFSKSLMAAALAHALPPPTPSVEKLLGTGLLSAQEDIHEGSGTNRRLPKVYEPGGQVQTAFEHLSLRDPTFSAYLQHHGLNVNALHALPDDVRAGTVRKIRNLVLIRDYYFRSSGNARSRKSFSMYVGAESMLSITDGNPRLLIAMTRSLLSGQNGPAARMKFPKTKQSAAIRDTLGKFWLLLEAQKGVKCEGIGGASVPDLIDWIGDSLRRRMIDRAFDENLALTIRIPPIVRPEIMRLLVRAVNTGALIHISGRGRPGPLTDDLAGRHFRLSYLLAAKYGLPLNISSAVSLEELLPSKWRTPRSTARQRPRSPSGVTAQGELFTTGDHSAGQEPSGSGEA